MKRVLFLLAAGTLVLSAADTIVASKHNLSSTGWASAASAEKQLCKFCHTPHGAPASTAEAAPLWGHDTSTITYAGLTNVAANGQSSTMACLSCHDGSVAINANTAVLGRDTSETALGAFTANATWGADGKILNKKDDLSSNHPVNVAYPLTASYMQNPVTQWTASPFPTLFAADGSKIRSWAGFTGTAAYVQCSSCHSVHGSTVAYTDGTAGKFMLAMPVDGSALCLKCHRK